jgi:hypothetical protein
VVVVVVGLFVGLDARIMGVGDVVGVVCDIGGGDELFVADLALASRCVRLL